MCGTLTHSGMHESPIRGGLFDYNFLCSNARTADRPIRHANNVITKMFLANIWEGGVSESPPHVSQRVTHAGVLAKQTLPSGEGSSRGRRNGFNLDNITQQNAAILWLG